MKKSSIRPVKRQFLTEACARLLESSDGASIGVTLNTSVDHNFISESVLFLGKTTMPPLHSEPHGILMLVQQLFLSRTHH